MRGEVKLWQGGMNLEPYFIRVVEGEGRILSIYNGVLYPARCISKEAAEYFGFQLDRGNRIQVEI